MLFSLETSLSRAKTLLVSGDFFPACRKRHDNQGKSHKCRSCSMRCALWAILAMFLVGFIYYKINVHNFTWYLSNSDGPCKISDKDMSDLLSLAVDTNTVLNSLKIHHFLVYGSLWGGLRYNGPLPWDNDFDFGIFYDEIIQYSEKEVQNKFKAFKINCYYSYRFGFYRVTRGSARGSWK